MDEVYYFVIKNDKYINIFELTMKEYKKTKKFLSKHSFFGKFKLLYVFKRSSFIDGNDITTCFMKKYGVEKVKCALSNYSIIDLKTLGMLDCAKNAMANNIKDEKYIKREKLFFLFL